jgi:hypothetical protein
MCVKEVILHNQLNLQAFTEVISIFKSINYFCQILSPLLLILSIDCLNRIVVVPRGLCEEELRLEEV